MIFSECKRRKKTEDMKKKIIFLILWMLPMAGWAQGPVTIKQVMDEMHRTRGVNFVYDSSLNVGQAYKGPDVKSLPLKEWNIIPSILRKYFRSILTCPGSSTISS